MASFPTLIERIRALGIEIVFAGPQSSDAITRSEEALEVELPPSYRRFLSTYGAGGTKHDWIAGIYQNDPLKSNDGYTYGETMRMRHEYGLPVGLVVIQSSPPEIVWCLDTREVALSQEAPVVAVNVLNKYHVEQISKDFDAFFHEYLSARVNLEE